MRWWLAAERARAQVDLPRLLRRELRLAGARAGGVRAGTVWAPPRLPPPRRRAGAPWRLTLDGLEIEDLRQVRVGPLRIAGRGRAAGSLRFVGGGEVEARLARLELGGGKLQAGRETLAPRAHLRAALHLKSFSPRLNPGARGLDFLSGSLRLSAPARLDLDLRLRDGKLLPGSRALYRPARLREAVRLALRARVTRAPGGARLVLGGSGEEIAVERPGGSFRAARLRLSAASSELRLSRLFPATQPVLWGDLQGDRVRLDLAGTRAAWSIALPRAAARIDLPALLRRELRLAGLRGDGADVRIAVGPARRRGTQNGPPRRRWSVRLADAHLSGLSHLEMGDLRLAGDVSAAGGLSWRGGTLALDRTEFTVASGRVARGEETLARALALAGEARLAPFRPGTLRGAENLRPLTARATVDGELASLGFLDPLLRKAPWLDLRGGGRLHADLRLDRGRLGAGSALRIAPARIEAEYLTSRARGSATVTGSVEEAGAAAPALALQILFDRFEIAARQPAGAAPHLRGRGLRLALTTEDLDLTHAARDVRLRIRLPAAEAPDLAAFNGYLPAGAGVAILSGAGRLSSDFELETAGNSGRGTLALTSPGVRVRFHDLGLAGALSLEARLAAADLASERFRLDGTRLVLERLTWGEPGAPAPVPAADGWWANVHLERGTVRWTRPLALDSTVAARMKDAGLFLALFARRQRAAGWLQGILAEERLAARAELRVADGAIALDPLRVTGERLDLRSRLRLSAAGKRGDLYVRYGRLATAIELDNDRRTYHLRRPLEWYESQRALQ